MFCNVEIPEFGSGEKRACRKGVEGWEATHWHCQSKESLTQLHSITQVALVMEGCHRIYHAHIMPIGHLSDLLHIIGSFPSLPPPSSSSYDRSLFEDLLHHYDKLYLSLVFHGEKHGI